MGSTTKYTERMFLGKTSGFRDKLDQRYEQKHLKAYLQGHERFRDGYAKQTNEDGTISTMKDFNGNPVPQWFDVLQQVHIDEDKRKQLGKEPKPSSVEEAKKRQDNNLLKTNK